MSGLSSRVMNMKFMRSANDKKTEDVESKAKVIDNSEWSLKDFDKIMATNKTPTIASVGYGNINSFNEEDSDEELTPVPVKRSWGDDKVEDSPAIEFSSIKASQKSKAKPSKQKSTSTKGTTSTSELESPDNITEDLGLPENIGELDANDFLNSVFKSKKRPQEDNAAPTKKLKKKKRVVN